MTFCAWFAFDMNPGSWLMDEPLRQVTPRAAFGSPYSQVQAAPYTMCTMISCKRLVDRTVFGGQVCQKPSASMGATFFGKGGRQLERRYSDWLADSAA